MLPRSDENPVPPLYVVYFLAALLSVHDAWGECCRRGLVRALGPDVSHQAVSVRSRCVTARRWRLWNFAPSNVRQNIFHGLAISVGVSICSTFISHVFIWASPLEYTHLLSAHPHYILQKHFNQLHLCVVRRPQSLSERMWADCWEQWRRSSRLVFPPSRTSHLSAACRQSHHQWTHLPAGPSQKGSHSIQVPWDL